MRELFRTLGVQLWRALVILTAATVAFVLLSLAIHGHVKWK